MMFPHILKAKFGYQMVYCNYVCVCVCVCVCVYHVIDPEGSSNEILNFFVINSVNVEILHNFRV